jgi:hypothetical protein
MSSPPTNCLECNAPLSPAETQGLCARCLLRMGLASQLEGASVTEAGARKFVPPPLFPFDFGGYRVLRLLGRGGMGAVYEAEQLATGRRVALKVLGQAIDSEEVRKRFLREGRLAASVNHPNSVYIFGSEEIEGAPVIAMELVAGGTLRDLMRKGPLGAREAVDVILQVVAGLEAAAGAGVLHRDVKPANCFVAPDGTVKVGDFGLSVSTLARHDSQLTATGVMLGTPAFAPPEQLRGDEIDVRADIYSVGATLYALLTAHAPFEADNAVKVVAAVLDKTAKPIAEFRQDVPGRLAQIVNSCLAKRREDRPADYAALRDALLPFSSHVPEPAPIGLRTVAGAVDCLLASSIGIVVLSVTGVSEDTRFLSARTLPATLEFLGIFLAGIAYFAIPEWLWGASLGKALCGLRVAPREFWRITLRAFILMLAMNMAVFIELGLSSATEFRGMVGKRQEPFSEMVGPWPVFLLFVTMRRRNGFAAMHDLATETRVIVRPKAGERPRLGVPPLAVPEAADGERLGPFRVTGSISDGTASGTIWVAGFDEVLRRSVWIRRHGAETPALAPERRDLGRAGRLRWIAGTRTGESGWDAFDAPAGRPLMGLSAQPWAAVRCWLLDLAEEFEAASKDGTLPAELGLANVWITTDGRAMLLDEPWPGSAAAEAAPVLRCEDTAAMQQFLAAVADTALDRTRQPLHAYDFLQKLGKASFDRTTFVIGNLRSLLAKPAAVSRWRRFSSVAIGPAAALLLALPVMAVMIVEHQAEMAKRGPSPDLEQLAVAAKFYEDFSAPEFSEKTDLPEASRQEVRKLLGKYLAGHFGAFIESPEFETHPALKGWDAKMRAELRATVRQYSPVTPEELTMADTALRPMLIIFGLMSLYFVIVGSLALLVGGTCVAQLVTLVFFRTTIGQRVFGFGVVTKRGEPATRRRMLWRWFLIWTPALVFAAFLGMAIVEMPGWRTGRIVLLSVVGGVWLIGVAWAVLRPGRGLHDRIAGTWVVPR